MSVELLLPAMVREHDVTRVARLRAMIDQHFDTVWRSLRRLGVPEAGTDDSAQQVFVVAARRLDEIEVGTERGYLLGIALRVASDARRAAARRREVPMDATAAAASPLVAPPAQPDEVLEHKRALARLAAALDQVTDELREAFVLFELEELTAPEVAKALGVPIGTVASRVRRAREQLRQNLGKRGVP
ncbi:MAG TPA: sigma-70 family RNA polymerase sigma factor [Polyangiaceae bacterium]|nr:sigma-70 family RNA polymerase sigma factor [Polyangiaceae bacterium]